MKEAGRNHLSGHSCLAMPEAKVVEVVIFKCAKNYRKCFSSTGRFCFQDFLDLFLLINNIKYINSYLHVSTQFPEESRTVEHETFNRSTLKQ